MGHASFVGTAYHTGNSSKRSTRRGPCGMPCARRKQLGDRRYSALPFSTPPHRRPIRELNSQGGRETFYLPVRTDVFDYIPLLEALAAQAHPDGGWGYAPGQAAHLEPTCLALLALSLDADRFREQLDTGRAALHRSAAVCGSYRLPQSREEAVCPTALVLFAHGVLGEAPDDLRRPAALMLARRSPLWVAMPGD